MQSEVCGVRDKSYDKIAAANLKRLIERDNIKMPELGVILDVGYTQCSRICNGHAPLDAGKMYKLFNECSYTPDQIVLGEEHVSIVRKRMIGTKGMSYDDYSICSPNLVEAELSSLRGKERHNRAAEYISLISKYL